MSVGTLDLDFGRKRNFVRTDFAPSDFHRVYTIILYIGTYVLYYMRIRVFVDFYLKHQFWRFFFCLNKKTFVSTRKPRPGHRRCYRGGWGWPVPPFPNTIYRLHLACFPLYVRSRNLYPFIPPTTTSSTLGYFYLLYRRERRFIYPLAFHAIYIPMCTG